MTTNTNHTRSFVACSDCGAPHALAVALDFCAECGARMTDGPADVRVVDWDTTPPRRRRDHNPSSRKVRRTTSPMYSLRSTASQRATQAASPSTPDRPAPEAPAQSVPTGAAAFAKHRPLKRTRDQLRPATPPPTADSGARAPRRERKWYDSETRLELPVAKVTSPPDLPLKAASEAHVAVRRAEPTVDEHVAVEQRFFATTEPIEDALLVASGLRRSAGARFAGAAATVAVIGGAVAATFFLV